MTPDRGQVTGTPVNPADSYSDLVEREVTVATALSGQPDFTYPAQTIRKSGGVRELGDTLMWVGSRLLILSTKSREPSAASSDSSEKAAAWLRKATKKAKAQIRGVRRTLRTIDGLTLQSERGVPVPFRSEAVTEIHGVIVVQHPGLAGTQVAPLADPPGFIVAAPDWGSLTAEIGSTAGILDYVTQRSALGLAQPLGAEMEVLGLIAAAEYSGVDSAEFHETPQGLLAPTGSWAAFRAQYPESVLGSQPSDRLGFLIDIILDGMHHMAPEFSDTQDPHDYLMMAEILDSIPRRWRGRLGRQILEKATEAREQDQMTSFRAQIRGRWWLLFIAHPGTRSERRESLQLLTGVLAFRQADLHPDDFEERLVLGVATEPYPNDGRSHDYFLANGLAPAATSLDAEEAKRVFAQYFSEDTA